MYDDKEFELKVNRSNANEFADLCRLYMNSPTWERDYSSLRMINNFSECLIDNNYVRCFDCNEHNEHVLLKTRNNSSDDYGVICPNCGSAIRTDDGNDAYVTKYDGT